MLHRRIDALLEPYHTLPHITTPIPTRTHNSQRYALLQMCVDLIFKPPPPPPFTQKTQIVKQNKLANALLSSIPPSLVGFGGGFVCFFVFCDGYLPPPTNGRREVRETTTPYETIQQQKPTDDLSKTNVTSTNCPKRNEPPPFLYQCRASCFGVAACRSSY